MTSWICFALVFLVLLVACGKGETELKPPDIRYGETECLECRMIISDPRFAAGYTRENQDGRYESIPFDDIGDMLVYADQHPEHNIVGYWVHDYVTEEWINGKAAYYVFSQHLETPMAFGIAAVESYEKGEQLAAEYDGHVLNWDGLLAKHNAGELGVASSTGQSPGGDGDHNHSSSMAASMGDADSTGLSGTFVAADDGSEILLTIVAPQKAGVGLQPIEISATQKTDHSQLLPVDGLALEIVPEMPSMGHSSANNQHPTPIGGGRYRGQVNFTMAGDWTVTAQVHRNAVRIGEIVFSFKVR